MPSPDITLIQTTAMQIWSHPTWDLILILVLFAGGFFYGLSSGKRRAFSTLVYSYMTLAIFSALPFDTIGQLLNSTNEFFLKVGLFFGIFLILIFLLGRGHRKGFARGGAWWQGFVLSFLQVGFLIHIVLGFLPKDKIVLLAPLTKYLFANPGLNLAWLIGPVAVLAFFRHFNKHEE